MATARYNIDDPEYLDYPDPTASGTAEPTPTATGAWWGTESTAKALPTDLEAGDPQYNQRQQEFESTVDWDWIAQNQKNYANEVGGVWDPSDLEGIRRNAGYDASHLGDAGLYNSQLQKYYQNSLDNILRGATNVPGGNEGSNDYSGPTRLRTGGGVNGANDPFGDAITGGIMDLINNKGDINGGARTQQRMESLQELMGRARKSQQNNLQGTLLSRNLMSEPGIPQGMEAGGYANIEERLAPAYASSLRDILSDESATQNANYLAALGLGNTRQSTLSDIALQTLDRNMEWNKFLAEFGLDRDQTLEALASGQDSQLNQLLNMFLNATGQSAGGRT